MIARHELPLLEDREIVWGYWRAEIASWCWLVFAAYNVGRAAVDGISVARVIIVAGAAVFFAQSARSSARLKDERRKRRRRPAPGTVR